MIKKITVKNWKSFEKLEYKFQSLNILLGNNSSGKSNFLDLLEFISKVAKGVSNEELNKIRGGIDFFKRINSNDLEIAVFLEKNKKILINYNLNVFEYFLEEDGIEILGSRRRVLNQMYSKEELFQKLSTLKFDFEKPSSQNIEKLDAEEIIKKIKMTQEKIITFEACIKNILVLDPTPSLIRGTTKHENRELLKDCSNLISFVAGMEEKEKINIEDKLAGYLKKLTFSEIQSVNFKFLGENKEFTQLYIEENGMKLHSDIISDGMLRFISIIVALMTQKSGGILAIEEIDNGIAPYQLKMLMDIVDEISAERQFDVVFTTHNHLLINYLGEEYMDFVFYVSKKDGKSNIKRIKDYPQYGKISSYGKLGDLVDNEEVINILNSQGDIDEA